jgi:hypothetical protein
MPRLPNRPAYGIPAAMLPRALFQFLALAATLCQAQEETIEVRLRWEPGQFYLQESDTDTTTLLTTIGQKHDQKLRMRQTTSIKVTKNDAGEQLARVSIDSLKGELLQDGLLHPFDSAKMADALPVLQKAVGGAAGRSFTLVYNPQGDFQDVRDISSMVSGGENPDLTSIADAKQLATLYRRSLEMGLPKIPVRPGDKWISDEVIPFSEAGQVQVKLKSKFEGIVDRNGRKHAQIAFEGTMETQPDEGTKRSVKVAADSKVTGQVFFDLERQTVSLSVLLAVVNLSVDGKILPVRQQVTTRLVAMKQAK